MAFWVNLCSMEGYRGRQWRQHGVAMESLAREAKTCPLYLHHPHCSSITCCQDVGQFEKSLNVCEVGAKKCCWDLGEKLRDVKVYVSVSLGLYVVWLCKVVVTDKRCSTFPRLILAAFMTHFRPWQVYMCMCVYVHLWLSHCVEWFVQCPGRRSRVQKFSKLRAPEAQISTLVFSRHSGDSWS